MSGKSRVYGLMALQEKARIAETLADLREVQRQQDEAARMVARLTEALDRQGSGGGVRVATQVMAERAMAAQLTAEVARQRDRAAALAERLAAGQARLAAQEHRQAKLSDEAVAARRQEAGEREAQRDAATPARRR